MSGNDRGNSLGEEAGRVVVWWKEGGRRGEASAVLRFDGEKCGLESGSLQAEGKSRGKFDVSVIFNENR